MILSSFHSVEEQLKREKKKRKKKQRMNTLPAKISEQLMSDLMWSSLLINERSLITGMMRVNQHARVW